MKRFIMIMLTVILVSAYVFPFSFNFFPAQNTKNMLAAVGLVGYVLTLLLMKKDIATEKGTLMVILLAFSIGFMVLLSMTLNNTSDKTYLSYPVTLILWLCAAYVSITAMKFTHGYASVSLVSQYFTMVSVLQCAIALLIDNYAPVKRWVLSWMSPWEMGVMQGRLFGIGCGLDVAGVRFSCILLMLAYLCYEAACEKNSKKLAIGLIFFAFIGVVGNMMARTTIVGVAVSLALWFVLSLFPKDGNTSGIFRVWMWFAGVVILAVVLCSILYNTNPKAKDNLRFGFEGFFSLAEKGYWETNSNNELKGMVVWPDNPRTWIIGDGYMVDPSKVEGYLIAENVAGDIFYKGTDIGYCRFIFYFGIIGLSIFIIYFGVVAIACGKRAPSKKICFFFIWLINMIVWAKVSTDVFAVLCIFLLTDIEEEDEDEEEEEEDEESTEENENLIPDTGNI